MYTFGFHRQRLIDVWTFNNICIYCVSVSL